MLAEGGIIHMSFADVPFCIRKYPRSTRGCTRVQGYEEIDVGWHEYPGFDRMAIK